METYQAKDFNNRQVLVDTIIEDYGRTVDRKDAQITGTVIQLEALGLSHNQTVWGVPVKASNYKSLEVNKISRGTRKPSKINKRNS